MKILAEEMLAKNLKPGDLFSSIGSTHWDNIEIYHSLGERVYIRTDEPSPKEQENEKIYKIIIKL